MKKILCTVVFLSAVLLSQAQISKGSILLGGTIGGGTVKSESGGSKNTQGVLMISPAFGYAYKTNSVIGVKLNYGHQINKYTGTTTKREITVYGGGLFYRKYLPLAKSFYLFGEAALDYAHASIEDEGNFSSQSTEKQSTVTLGLTPGIAFAVNKYIHLEASINDIFTLQYGTSKKTYQSIYSPEQKTSFFNIAANASSSAPLSIGIRFVLGK